MGWRSPVTVKLTEPQYADWPPADAPELVFRWWHDLGGPDIPLGPGVVIANLEKWFRPALKPEAAAQRELEIVRVFLVS